MENFPPEVIESLRTYVYRLIDPRNGETFYVGKGTGNRVFSHIRQEQDIEGDELENKLARIREIRLAGLEVGHVIHRHGMDDETALEVESALIDAYPGITNAVGGIGGNEFGAMDVQEIVTKYHAEEAEFQHDAILISVNRSALAESSLYEATRYAWRIDRQRAADGILILAVVQGIIKGAFIADKWLEATTENFPGRLPAPGRLGFNGHDADQEIWAMYISKRLPDQYRGRNPIRYVQAAGA